MEPLRQQAVPIVGVTSYGDNYLRREASHTLTVSSHEQLYSKITDFATDESIGFVLNALYARCFVLDYDENLRAKIETSRRVEAERVATLSDLLEPD